MPQKLLYCYAVPAALVAYAAGVWAAAWLV